LPITERIVSYRSGERRGEGRSTVGVDGPVLAFCDVEEVWPFSYVREVEVEVICLGQRVEVGGVEFEDVHRVEGTKGRHFGTVYIMRSLSGPRDMYKDCVML
jgi:hypothetical protein